MKYAFLKWMSRRLNFTLFVRGISWCGKDYDKLLKFMVRGFQGRNLVAQLRFQPPEPMIRLLARRLAQFDSNCQSARIDRAHWLRKKLTGNLLIPRRVSEDHQYWVFPVHFEDPDAMIAVLRNAGFDATQSGRIVVVETPEGHSCPEPEVARQLWLQTVFVPVYPEMPWYEVKRMGNLIGALYDCERLQGQKLQHDG